MSAAALGAGWRVDKDFCIAGVALGAAILLGMAAAGLLIWRRKRLSRRTSSRRGRSLRMRRSGSAPSDSMDLKLEQNGKGEPVLLGQGSFAKVCMAVILTAGLIPRRGMSTHT